MSCVRVGHYDNKFPYKEKSLIYKENSSEENEFEDGTCEALFTDFKDLESNGENLEDEELDTEVELKIECISLFKKFEVNGTIVDSRTKKVWKKKRLKVEMIRFPQH